MNPPLVVENIGVLCTCADGQADPLARITDAVVHGADGRVTYAGPAASAPAPPTGALVVDAGGNAVLPGLIDCHTHLVFGGDRADEFAMRARGATYAEIMAAGGGIRRTVDATRAATHEELFALAEARLRGMLERGVTCVEVKSGYGLTLDDERKTLEVIRDLNAALPQTLVPTFLGAHLVPPEFEGRADDYVNVVVNEMLPSIAGDGLAEACDVFVERGAFSVAQGERILARAKELGLRLHVHAEQLSHTGAAALAARVGARSASHLEFIDDDGIAALAEAGVIAEVLSGAQVFLGIEERIPGRKLRDAGLEVAVATDLNPGSSHVPDLHLAAGFAITHCGLFAEEAIRGITRGGAKVLDRQDRGHLVAGAICDLVVLDSPSPFGFVYEWGKNHVARVVVDGREVSPRG